MLVNNYIGHRLLREIVIEYQLMSNARVEYVKSIRKKRRLKERYGYCLNIPIFQVEK